MLLLLRQTGLKTILSSCENLNVFPPFESELGHFRGFLFSRVCEHVLLILKKLEPITESLLRQGTQNVTIKLYYSLNVPFQLPTSEARL